jgi:hypothetical protein
MRKSLIAISLLTALAATPVLAQSAAPSAAPATNKAALSKSCSDQANAKGLHGKARKHFRSACKRGH